MSVEHGVPCRCASRASNSNLPRAEWKYTPVSRDRPASGASGDGEERGNNRPAQFLDVMLLLSLAIVPAEAVGQIARRHGLCTGAPATHPQRIHTTVLVPSASIVRADPLVSCAQEGEEALQLEGNRTFAKLHRGRRCHR